MTFNTRVVRVDSGTATLAVSLPMRTVHELKAAAVRDRVLAGVSDLIAAGADVTFAKAAAATGVPERTIYRHFPTRDALMAALFEHTNRRIGFEGELPT